MIRIPTKTHGIIDYLTGAAMLAAPMIMNGQKTASAALVEEEDEMFTGEEGGISESTVLAAMGGAILTQGLMTDYELGAIKMMDMKAHLLVDVAAGVMLAASPWLLNLSPKTRLPFAALGLGIAAIGLLTNVNTGDEDADE
jgi:hypothetical protein